MLTTEILMRLELVGEELMWRIEILLLILMMQIKILIHLEFVFEELMCRFKIVRHRES
jgi:hypothetical protein